VQTQAAVLTSLQIYEIEDVYIEFLKDIYNYYNITVYQFVDSGTFI